MLGLSRLGDWPARARQYGTEAAGQDAVTGSAVIMGCTGLGAGRNLAWSGALGGMRA